MVDLRFWLWPKALFEAFESFSDTVVSIQRHEESLSDRVDREAGELCLRIAGGHKASRNSQLAAAAFRSELLIKTCFAEFRKADRQRHLDENAYIASLEKLILALDAVQWYPSNWYPSKDHGENKDLARFLFHIYCTLAGYKRIRSEAHAYQLIRREIKKQKRIEDRRQRNKDSKGQLYGVPSSIVRRTLASLDRIKPGTYYAYYTNTVYLGGDWENPLEIKALVCFPEQPDVDCKRNRAYWVNGAIGLLKGRYAAAIAETNRA